MPVRLKREQRHRHRREHPLCSLFHFIRKAVLPMTMDRHLLGVIADLQDQIDQLGVRMTTAETAQAALDANVAALNVALGNIEVEIAALKANAPADLDFSGLDAAVARLQVDTTVDENPPVDPTV